MAVSCREVGLPETVRGLGGPARCFPESPFEPPPETYQSHDNAMVAATSASGSCPPAACGPRGTSRRACSWRGSRSNPRRKSAGVVLFRQVVKRHVIRVHGATVRFAPVGAPSLASVLAFLLE